jgi:hypothetical protein
MTWVEKISISSHLFFCLHKTSIERRQDKIVERSMSLTDTRSASIVATAAVPGAPGLLTQIGMAGGAAVITVTFIHPIDVIKVCD